MGRLAQTLGLRKRHHMTIPSEIQALIESSGNSFHARVAQWFSAEGWHLQVSPYYLDPTQQKAREIDLIAERHWAFKDGFARHEGYVVVRLYIECKFVPSHAVFWFAEKSKREADDLVHSIDGFTPNNIYALKHHYLAQSERVAKLFTSSQSKLQEADLFYKALNQILSAYAAFRHQPSASGSPSLNLHGKIVTMNFPVIVCSSFKNVYAADFLGQLEPSIQQQNFQLEVRYAYGDASSTPRNEYFLIDIASYDNLSLLTQAIEVDVEAASYLNSSH